MKHTDILHHFLSLYCYFSNNILWIWHVCVLNECLNSWYQVTMADREAAERAVKDANPIIDGRKANVNLAYLGAKPRSNNTSNGEFFSLFLESESWWWSWRHSRHIRCVCMLYVYMSSVYVSWHAEGVQGNNMYCMQMEMHSWIHFVYSIPRDSKHDMMSWERNQWKSEEAIE